MSLNRVILMGRLVRDPELRRTNSGKAVTSFSIAVEEDYSGKDKEKKTNFIDCVAWGPAEFIAKYFTQGRMIVVEGRLSQNLFKDQAGNNRSRLEVIVESAYFGDSKKDGNNGGNGGNAYGGGNGSTYGGGNGNTYGGGNGNTYGGGYSAPSGGAGFAPPPQAGAGFATAPAVQGGGYSAPQAGGYSAPTYGNNQFEELNGEDDVQLPF